MKRRKASELRGLVANWKKNIDLLSHIACKHPVKFIDNEDDVAEAKFDQAEGSDILNAIHASKPSSVRIDTINSKLVCLIII
jgi:hypothetical protein